MIARTVDENITLVKYYPSYKKALSWYQDKDLCKQVDNIDYVYDLDLLKRMYSYLNAHGNLFYIKCKNRLCGDVTLLNDGDVAIVICKEYQNKHIGRKVIEEIKKLAKELNMEKITATIYTFNKQSRAMFAKAGFIQVGEELFECKL